MRHYVVFLDEEGFPTRAFFQAGMDERTVSEMVQSLGLQVCGFVTVEAS
jgi:hypothetical protein